jgi:hypothetical protein
MLRTIQMTFLAAGLVAMSAAGASAAQNPDNAQGKAQGEAKSMSQPRAGAKAENGTGGNLSSTKQKQMGATAEGGSNRNLRAGGKEHFASSGGGADVSVSRGHSRARTNVYSYNEEPNIIVRKHSRRVIYGENEPQVTIKKRRHYYGTAYAPGVTTYGYRSRHGYGSRSSASIGISQSESISRSRTRTRGTAAVSESSSSKSSNARNGAGFKGRTMAKSNEMGGANAKTGKPAGLSQGSQGRRTGMNQSSSMNQRSGSNQGSTPRSQ